MLVALAGLATLVCAVIVAFAITRTRARRRIAQVVSARDDLRAELVQLNEAQEAVQEQQKASETRAAVLTAVS